MKMLSVVKASELKVTQPEFLIKHLIPVPAGGITMISSRGGYGKTFLAMRMAMEMVIEKPNTKILMWLTEDPQGIIKNRAKSIAHEFLSGNTSILNNIDIVSSPAVQLAYKERGLFKPNPKLALLFDDMMPYDAIFFDPLLAFFGGEENDNSQARIFMQPFMDYAKITDKALIFLHHSTKQTKDMQSVTRGAGAFTDACRVAYEINMVPTAIDPRLRSISIVKDNWGAKIHFGVNKELIIIPQSVKLEVDDGEENMDNVRVSYSTDISKNYQHKITTMDKLKYLVTSEYYYSGTIFKDGQRSVANAEPGQDIVILDFDDGMELEQAKEIFSAYDCVIATTKSHRKEKNGKVFDRYRVIIKTDKPINLQPDEFSELMSEIIRYYGSDKACKDISRCYAPYKDAEVFRYYGERLNWKRFWTQLQVRKLRTMMMPERDDKKILKAINTLFDNEFYAGNRNNTVVRAIKWLKDEGLQELEIRDIIEHQIDTRGGLGDGDKEKMKIFRTHLRDAL